MQIDCKKNCESLNIPRQYAPVQKKQAGGKVRRWMQGDRKRAVLNTPEKK
jgi:hypothetical protein